jgi:hypothetical protein
MYATCYLSGQTGNQLFQIAATISLARDNNIPWYIPEVVFSRYMTSTPFGYLPRWSEEESGRFQFMFRETNNWGYKPIPYYGTPICIKGWFQSYKYFINHIDYIREVINIPINPAYKGKVGIHVRRGDYLRWPKKFPVVTEQYIRQAMKMFGTSAEFVFFSDGKDWVESHFPGYEINQTPTDKPLIAMGEMASCSHNIIANSSFSYWGAMLNSNPDKIVVAPHYLNWFGPQGPKSINTICPPEWTQIRY